MYAVGRLGSYFARGVYKVSGPFHPFGGAVDIIVVEQPDGSFKSSPWYVRFGKFQGVLKTREEVVSIDVNGVDANFHMYLDHKGEAYFLKEVDIEEGESVFCPSSSGDETDGQCSSDRRPTNSKSCNYDADLNSADRIGGSEIKVLSRSNSHRAKILGLVFGRRSLKEDGYKEGEDGIGMVRLSSLERANYAADLLEVKWSTNLASSRARKDNDSGITSPDASGEGVTTDKQVDDEHPPVESLVHDDEKDGSYNSVLKEEANIDISILGTNKQVIDTSTLGESILEERFEMVSEISRTDEFGVGNVYHDACKEHTQPDSVLQCELEASDSKQFEEEQACKKKDAAVPACVISEERGTDRIQSFVCCDTSESSVVGTDVSNERTHENFYHVNGGCGEVHVHLETLHVTTELLPEDANGEVGKDPAEASKNCSDQMNAAPCELDYNALDLEKPLRVQGLSTQIVTVEPALCLSKEVESQNIYTTSSVTLEVQDGDDLRQSLASAGDSQKYFGVLEAGSDAPSESSEEEQLLFGDLDEFKVFKDASSPDYEKNVNHPLSDDGGFKEVNGSVNTNDEEPSSSSNMLVQNNESADPENLIEESSVMSSPITIPKNPDGDEKVGRLAESLPILWSPTLNLTADDTQHPLSQSLDTKSEALKWTLLSESDPSSNANEDQQFAQERSNTADTLLSEEIKAVHSSPVSGNPSQTIVSSGGSWRLWPFSLSRSSSMKAMQPALSENEFSDAEILRESINCMDGTKSVSESKIVKKILRSITPTSEQLASLNLKEGGNTVTFTFSTPMLGKQQVDARIYLWKWNTRIVISDVDGTITKSDVLGQFMPLVGMDWSQTGVVHLFSAIKENGYQFLFLSARSISQAYITRRFLFNLKQDGKALPEGPVLISPDGLFPSLFREVIRRAPHEFKIACLEDVRALFPADCNPFYAGFGNRDTDEISYLKVGIPRGKIFTINPKGEIAVNRRVDTKSYSSLHALVHGMFPPTTSSEQEDFNSWNFWKLPPPEFDI